MPTTEQYQNLVSQAGPKGGINSKQQLAMFLAEIMWESDGLRAKREYACYLLYGHMLFLLFFILLLFVLLFYYFFITLFDLLLFDLFDILICKSLARHLQVVAAQTSNTDQIKINFVF